MTGDRSPFRIRGMEARDLAQVAALDRTLFPAPWSEATFRRELDLPQARCRVAVSPEGGDEVLGYCLSWAVADEAELHRLAVRPEARRRGVASGLLADLFTLVRAAGGGRIFLEVGSANEAARRLYEAFGFALAGVRTRYYGETGEDGMVLSVDLAGACARNGMKTEAGMAEATVASRREEMPGHVYLRMHIAGPFAFPRAGQFVMVRQRADRSRLLGRPLSVYGFTAAADGGELDLLFRVAGEGTRLLAALREGETVGILGPLGAPFDIPAHCTRACLVAGGMGVVPLTALARQIRRERPDMDLQAFLGARTEELLPGRERFASLCRDLRVCTDDGTCGHCGFVTDLLSPTLGGLHGPETAFYACGPEAMLRRLQALFAENDAFCQVSVEERMACGFGACLGCAVPVREKNGVTYRRVCKEGPVFLLRDLAWEAM